MVHQQDDIIIIRQQLNRFRMKAEVAYLFFNNNVDHIILNIFGVLISAYSLYIEIRKHKDKDYKAFCDFNEHMSCSKVLTSKYSTGFGIAGVLFGTEHFLNAPNCVIGMIFYSIQLLLGLFHSHLASQVLYYLSITSVLGSLYLAFILFVVLKDLCLVCITIYAVNGCLLYINYHRYYVNGF